MSGQGIVNRFIAAWLKALRQVALDREATLALKNSDRSSAPIQPHAKKEKDPQRGV
jgi:hypothetical protein